jgi:hypothetical protein
MRLKKFLPFEYFVLQTNLTMAEVLGRIADNIEPRKGLRLDSYPEKRIKQYEGRIIDNNFEINRIIDYKNSFLPMISGQIQPGTNNMKIFITMRPAVFVLALMAIVLGTTGSACLTIIIMVIINFNKILQQGISPMILIPFGMFILGYGMIIIGFKMESKKAKEFLIDLLEAF